MLNVLIVTQAVLLVLVAILGTLLLATIRQVGVLFERVAPLGALTLPHALNPGQIVPPLAVQGLGGEPIVLGGIRESKKGQVLLFISPACPMCKQILGLLRSFAYAESRSVDIVLVGEGSQADHADIIAKYGLTDLPVVLDSRVGTSYQVGKLPYAMLIDAAGILRSAGLVNSREHLESLVVALESGFESVQAYLRSKRGSRSDGATLAPSAKLPEAWHGDGA